MLDYLTSEKRILGNLRLRLNYFPDIEGFTKIVLTRIDRRFTSIRI